MGETKRERGVSLIELVSDCMRKREKTRRGVRQTQRKGKRER